MVRKTQYELISESKNRFPRLFDYSNVIYQNANTPVIFVCILHNIQFPQKFNNHLLGKSGCPICKKIIKQLRDLEIRKQKFLNKAILIHNNEFDYSKMNFINNNTKIEIICKEGHHFFDTPKQHNDTRKHKNGYGCNICSTHISKYTAKSYIKKANEVHNNKYDYSLITNETFKNLKDIVYIKCPEHTVFPKNAGSHVYGYGCNECNNHTAKMTNCIFLKKAKKLYENKYEYPNLNIENGNKSKIKILCKRKHITIKIVADHLNGSECTMCNKIDKFLILAKNTHLNRFDYSRINYIKNVNESVEIICSEHGVFEQKPCNHIKGYGCWLCSESNGERRVRLYLKNKNINHKREIRITNELFNEMRYDFYLPERKIFIEYDGEQHFDPSYGSKHKLFERNNHKIDAGKDMYVSYISATLIRIHYKDFKNVETILDNILNKELNQGVYYSRDNYYKDLDIMCPF